MSLMSMKLDNNHNYPLWEYLITPILRVMDGWGHIVGSTKCPLVKDDPQYSDWVRKDNELIVVINSKISDSILSVLPSAMGEVAYTSYNLWELLKEMYSTQGAADPERLLLLEEGSNRQDTLRRGAERAQEEEEDQVRAQEEEDPETKVKVLDIKPISCPKAMKDWIRVKEGKVTLKSKEHKALSLSAKQHLRSLGWTIKKVSKSKGPKGKPKRKIWKQCYVPPTEPTPRKRKYSSLLTAYKDADKEQNVQQQHLQEQEQHQQEQHQQQTRPHKMQARKSVG